MQIYKNKNTQIPLKIYSLHSTHGSFSLLSVMSHPPSSSPSLSSSTVIRRQSSASDFAFAVSHNTATATSRGTIVGATNATSLRASTSTSTPPWTLSPQSILTPPTNTNDTAFILLSMSSVIPTTASSNSHESAPGPTSTAMVLPASNHHKYAHRNKIYKQRYYEKAKGNMASLKAQLQQQEATINQLSSRKGQVRLCHDHDQGTDCFFRFSYDTL